MATHIILTGNCNCILSLLLCPTPISKLLLPSAPKNSALCWQKSCYPTVFCRGATSFTILRPFVGAVVIIIISFWHVHHVPGCILSTLHALCYLCHTTTPCKLLLICSYYSWEAKTPFKAEMRSLMLSPLLSAWCITSTSKCELLLFPPLLSQVTIVFFTSALTGLLHSS